METASRLSILPLTPKPLNPEPLNPKPLYCIGTLSLMERHQRLNFHVCGCTKRTDGNGAGRLVVASL